jgi:Kef-type K+ transport system membrane component KefB
MSSLSYGNLLAVVLISFLVPLLIGFFPFIRVPAPVLLIVLGIAVGPSGFGWVKIDQPVKVLSVIGLAFLLFLAGLEIDPRRLRGPIARQVGSGYLISLALAAVVGFGVSAGGVTKSPLLIAIALSATSLGLIVPVLKDAGQSESQVGRFAIAGASVADFGAVLLLSVFFSMSKGSMTGKFILLGGFIVLIVVSVVTLSRLGTSARLNSVLVMLQDTTAEIRVRFAVVLLVAFVVLASKFGLETILGAFLAGAILNFVDRDSISHPNFRVKLDAIGYGFVVPVFFVTSGLAFDSRALVHSPSAFAQIPLFLLGLLVVRGVPAVVYGSNVGRRNAIAIGLLQATSLPFLVVASAIGVSLGTIKPVTGTALVSAGLLSCVIFPLVALILLRRSNSESSSSESSSSEVRQLLASTTDGFRGGANLIGRSLVDPRGNDDRLRVSDQATRVRG